MEFPGSSGKAKRHERERTWAIGFVLALAVLFGLLEGWFMELREDLPFFGNILLFGLINLNVILLLLLTYLVLRNVAKLIFERRRNILGNKLKTRLVIAFVGLTFIPTLPLFWLSTHVILSSLDSWFSHQVEQSLEQSVALGKDYLEQEGRNLVGDAGAVATQLAELMAEGGWFSPAAGEGDGGEFPSATPQTLTDLTEKILKSLLLQHQLDAFALFDRGNSLLWEVKGDGLENLDLAAAMKALNPGDVSPMQVQALRLADEHEGLVTYADFPPAVSPRGGMEGRLLAVKILPGPIKAKLASISSGYDDYLQLKLLKNPIRISHFVIFSIVTLLVIFGGVWFGFFLAKSITGPLQGLLSATQRVAEGDLNVHLDSERPDEMGQLVTSFNKMVRDLRDSREELDRAYGALQGSLTELEERRLYMEIVLGNIAAGVVSVDADGKIMTINKSAEETLGLEAGEVKGRLYSDVMSPAHMEIVKSFVEMYRMSRHAQLEKQIEVILGNRPMVLLVKVSVLLDGDAQYMGAVLVFDDLTELEKAQRMAAWREVARRIAHEIKNPITPIQLCAQRLRRKFLDRLGPDGAILDECTRTIIQQVDQMKHLVNEFSKFARLPKAQLAQGDLVSIVEDALTLYRHTHPRVPFILDKHDTLPLLRLDEGQIKQAIINLLENAVQALEGGEGSIRVQLFHDAILRIVRLECADTGHGLSPEDKLRMFEPYYSTREKGTGLGLPIVANIVADHNGFIRVRDNVPKGTVIVIELPA
ncbi:MAG: HAMP domain-containing protein [Syntrophobacteraceae bacterium]|nr:HAMP domain-containing protein [Syntrophobacteraceae bacterium]